eukprot:jgi/Mesen1/3237/ME000187S02403
MQYRGLNQKSCWCACSFLCYLSGVVMVLLLPALAKDVYVDESALIPGSALSTFMWQDALAATQLAAELVESVRSAPHAHLAVEEWATGHLAAMGADVYLHPSPSPSRSCFTGGCRAGNGEQKQKQQGERGRGSVVGIVRAPQAYGDEAIVLVTPYRLRGGSSGEMSGGDALALGLGLALMRVLKDALWLARDVIWLVADATDGADAPVSHWLHDYHRHPAPPTGARGPSQGRRQQPCRPEEKGSRCDWSPAGGEEGHPGGGGSGAGAGAGALGEFLRGGMIASAVVLEVDPAWAGGPLEELQVRAEGPAGQMPNLDLLSTAYRLATWREGVRVSVDSFRGMEDWRVVRWLGAAQERVGRALQGVNREWRVGVPRESYVLGAAALAKTMANQVFSTSPRPHPPTADKPEAEQHGQQHGQQQQHVMLPSGARQCRVSESGVGEWGRACVTEAVGRATGAHGPFRQYQIDALTLHAVASSSSHSPEEGAHSATLSGNDGAATVSMFRIGRVAESLTRCLNNLLEKFHHSYYFYLLCGPHKFVPIAVYVGPFFLLLAPLLLTAASLSSSPIHGHPSARAPSRPSSSADKVSSAEGIGGAHVGGMWVHAILRVACFHLWGLLAGLLQPGVVSLAREVCKSLGFAHATALTAGLLVSSWALSFGLLLLTLGSMEGRRDAHEQERGGCPPGASWVALKMIMLGSLAVLLAAVSSINFSLAILSALLLAPLCVFCRPVFSASAGEVLMVLDR